MRARLTMLSTLVLASVLGLASLVIVNLVDREIRNDLASQNEVTLIEIADQLEDGANPFALRLPLGSDGTEFAILTTSGEYLNASIAQPVFFDEATFELEGTTNDFGLLPGDVIVGPDGTEFTIPEGLTPEELDETLFSIDSDLVEGFFTETNFIESQIAVTTPSGDDLLVEAYSPLALIERNVDRVRSVLLLVIPLVAALFAGLAWITTGRALKPVDEMTAKADRISTDTLDQRLEQPGTNDEIARLATTLNSMLDRLDRGAQAQKQFVSDASHELQSPLTVMIGEAELASRDPQKLVAANELVVEHGRRMATLIQDLLDLSRTGEVIPDRSEIDLDELVRNEARLNPSKVDTSRVQPVRILGDHRSLTRVIRNLIDNATRYGNGEVQVSTSFEPAKSVAVISIDDDGKGIPVADRISVFDRFTRLDESRNRSTGGTGLGLAIAKSIVEAHGGTISIEDSALGGARFRIELPTS